MLAGYIEFTEFKAVLEKRYWYDKILCFKISNPVVIYYFIVVLLMESVNYEQNMYQMNVTKG